MAPSHDISLPQKVVRQDRELDARRQKDTEELMKLRWHWTLDESNAERVSLREYARQVGVNDTTVTRDAKGWELMTARASAGTPMQPTEARERANMGAETEAATAAVAEKHDVPFKTARTKHYDEVRAVRDSARDRAERNETTVEEEIPTVMEWQGKKQRADERTKESRKADHTGAWIQAHGKLAKARRLIEEVNTDVDGVEFNDEEAELFAHDILDVKEALRDLWVEAAPAEDIDWDGAFSKLGSS